MADRAPEARDESDLDCGPRRSLRGSTSLGHIDAFGVCTFARWRVESILLSGPAHNHEDAVTHVSPPDLSASRLYINRELSWLEFNARVLEEAQDETNPLLERLKFISIFMSNLDEFFMIRVANLRELEHANVSSTPADGLTPREQLDAIASRCHELMDERNACLTQSLLPALHEEGARLLDIPDLTDDEAARLGELFMDEIFPVLTPLTVDPSHPFPHLANLSINLIVTFRTEHDGELPYAFVTIPDVLGPWIPVNASGLHAAHVLLSTCIRYHIGELFPGVEVTGAWLFRVTRNSDLALEEQEVENLLQDLERELRSRVFRRAVRLEVESSMPKDVQAILTDGLELPCRDVYLLDGALHVGALMGWTKEDRFRLLKDAPFNPRLNPRLATSASIFSVIRDGDLLLYHPFESFSTVVELLQHAAHDPKVLAIKLTLYRTSGDSVIIQALKDAAQNGKQVTAVVELKARFDEKNNIVWARELERAGCHVVYGIVGLKIHCKAALVVRRESGMVRRYVHLSTGNYNSTTARLYTDLGLLSQDPELGEDVSQLFNILTGYTARAIYDAMHGRRPEPEFNKLYISPFALRDHIVELIDEEIAAHRTDGNGLIQMKINSLVDPSVIEALYRASINGVRVRLNVRGICSLRPGIPGVSENIEVTSVVDRFLEHPRIFHFRHGGADLVFASSADLMPRNLYRRIETLFPIETPELKRRVIDEILYISLNDNVKARRLLPDGTYERVVRSDDAPTLRSQNRFIELAREAGLKSVPYDMAVREARRQRRERKRRFLRGRPDPA